MIPDDMNSNNNDGRHSGQERLGRGNSASNAADMLVELALSNFRFGRSDKKETFAVRRDGPNIAMFFEAGKSCFRSELARLYYKEFRKAPSAGTLNDAINVLLGEAMESEPEPVFVRLARSGDHIVLDLGDESGRVILISEAGWTVSPRSPVLFRRTALTKALPGPDRNGDIIELRKLLNVDDASFRLVVGWLVAAFIPDIDHPIAMLGGQRGTGKSTGACTLRNLIDPSTVPLQASPRNGEDWAVGAVASWCVCIDNVSEIKGWLQDALCRAVSGDGMVRRQLYTDSDLSVIEFRRCVLLTSIDAGALRGDLAERLLLLDLEPIPGHMRKPGSELDRQFMESQPEILGALLDLVVKVLDVLPSVNLSPLPRMADFAMVLAALDTADAVDGSCLATYLGQESRIASDVCESDQVAVTIHQTLERAGEWSGTATDLFKEITPDPVPRNWPKDAARLSGHLKGLVPALETTGVRVRFYRSPDSTRKRMINLSFVETASAPSIPSGPSERDFPDDGDRDSWSPPDQGPRPGEWCSASREHDRFDDPEPSWDPDPHAHDCDEQPTF